MAVLRQSTRLLLNNSVQFNQFKWRSMSLCSMMVAPSLVQCHGKSLISPPRRQHLQQPVTQPQQQQQLRYYGQRKNTLSKSDGGYRSSDSDSDSDSDHEHRERGAFWLRKMRTFHGLLDVNKDGVIGYDDYKLLAEKFTALGHLSPQASQEFREVMEKLWEEQWGEVSPYNLVPVEKYLSEMQHVLNDKSLKKKVHRFLPYLFQAVDKDNSGSISLIEFKLFFKCLGLSDQDATRSFAAIDVNNDGRLSMKEFVKLGRDYFITEDERRVSKQFWGPLANH